MNKKDRLAMLIGTKICFLHTMDMGGNLIVKRGSPGTVYEVITKYDNCIYLSVICDVTHAKVIIVTEDVIPVDTVDKINNYNCFLEKDVLPHGTGTRDYTIIPSYTLKELRLRKGYGILTVADALEISGRYYSQIESDVFPKKALTKLPAIARFFNVPVDSIIIYDYATELNMLNNSVQLTLKEWRTLAGISIKEISIATGIAENLLYQLELSRNYAEGSRTGLGHLARICKAFKLCDNKLKMA